MLSVIPSGLRRCSFWFRCWRDRALDRFAFYRDGSFADEIADDTADATRVADDAGTAFEGYGKFAVAHVGGTVECYRVENVAFDWR